MKKLRDADAMLAAGKDLAVVLQTLEISEATLARWRNQYGGMKSEEAKRLKQLEDENSRLKKLVAEQALDIAAPQGSGMVASAIREALELSRTFRGYVWLNAFSQNLAQLGTLFAILLGSGALRTEAPGTLYTLSLPVSRRALMTTRATAGLVELLVLMMVPALAIAMLAPAVGERYSIVDALVHGTAAEVALARADLECARDEAERAYVALRPDVPTEAGEALAELVFSRAVIASGEARKGRDVARRACTRIRKRASLIDNPALRRSFEHRVLEHVELARIAGGKR